MSIFIPNNNKYNKYFKVRNKHHLFEQKVTSLKFEIVELNPWSLVL